MEVGLGGVWFAEGAMVGGIFLEMGVLVAKKPGFDEEGTEGVVEGFGVS